MSIELISAIAGVLGALNLGQFVMFFVNKRKHNADSKLVESQSDSEIASASKSNAEATAVLIQQMKIVVDASNKKIDELQESLVSEQEKTEKMRKMLDRQIELAEKLQEDIDDLQFVYFNMPFPQWLKDQNGIMSHINSHYERVFLLPQGKTMKDYIGNDDVHIWGEKLGREYQKNDRKVIDSQDGYWRGVESIPSSPHEWEIIKYAMYIRGEYKGIAGIAMPLN